MSSRILAESKGDRGTYFRTPLKLAMHTVDRGLSYQVKCCRSRGILLARSTPVSDILHEVMLQVTMTSSDSISGQTISGHGQDHDAYRPT